jgi:ribonuclease HI
MFETDDTLICFTDGSVSRNGYVDATGGFAIIWPYHREFDYKETLLYHPITNNRAELSAVVYAFKQAEKIDPTNFKTLMIYTDSMLVIKSMTEWLPKWKSKNFLRYDGRNPVMNQDLIKTIDEYTIKRKVKYIHVKAHTKQQTWEAIYNDEVDTLAKSTHIT